MELTINDKPKLEMRHLDFAMAHGEVYGKDVSTEEYEQKVNFIEKGIFQERYYDFQKCYEIMDDGMYVGDILYYDSCNEISVLIFDEYSNRGYAYKAIKKLMDEVLTDIKSFEAVVMSNNKNPAVRKLLSKLGFFKAFVTDNYNEIWIYR